jgi:outer membrane protein assembly factor BamB
MNRKNGKVIWEKTVKEILPHEGHHGDHGFASSTPVTDGKYVWVNFGSRGVYCLDMKGTVKWSKELGKMKTRASFGEGSSPVLVGENLTVVMDHEGQSAIYALNKNSGDIAWEKDRDEQTSWTTPLVLDIEGKTQIIVNGTKRTRSYDPAAGDVIWECGGQTQNVIPTPVAGFGMVFCASGFRGNKLQAIKLGKTGDLTDTDSVVWQVGKDTPYVPSPLLYGEKLYVLRKNSGVLSCYNARTGEPYYVSQKLDEMKGIYASPVAAAGRVYLTGRKGVTYVLKNSDSFEVVAVNKLDDDIDCSLAIAGDEIYLKGKKYLYCIAKKN